METRVRWNPAEKTRVARALRVLYPELLQDSTWSALSSYELSSKIHEAQKVAVSSDRQRKHASLVTMREEIRKGWQDLLVQKPVEQQHRVEEPHTAVQLSEETRISLLEKKVEALLEELSFLRSVICTERPTLLHRIVEAKKEEKKPAPLKVENYTPTASATVLIYGLLGSQEEALRSEFASRNLILKFYSSNDKVPSTVVADYVLLAGSFVSHALVGNLRELARVRYTVIHGGVSSFRKELARIRGEVLFQSVLKS